MITIYITNYIYIYNYIITYIYFYLLYSNDNQRLVPPLGLRLAMLKTFFNKTNSLSNDVKAGLFLIAATICALGASNSGLSSDYARFLNTNLHIGIANFALSKPLLLWINDGLMAVFFFLVGLEIKREIFKGELNSIQKSILPVIAAIGGMALPALIFFIINSGNLETLNGWAIPAATDIAFALGILALIGARAPASLKILLLAIAIIDDLGVIVIIALFYSADIALSYLSVGLAAIFFAFIAGRQKITKIWLYLILGIVSWFCFLKAGIHPTLAGVLLAFAIPLSGDSQQPVFLETLEHSLYYPVAFFILPLFAFANAGVSLAGLSLDLLFQPLPLGIALGLFLGKQIGIFGSIWITVKCRLAPMPAQSSWRHIYGLSCLTGIGFTMSLFIGGLAFESPLLIDQVKLGVLAGSLTSAILGFTLLYLASPATQAQKSATD